jgi:uncharacterized protein YbjT (DUF2867 family)
MATIAIAGAGGFVGRNLLEALRGKHSLIALGRARPAGQDPGVEWREAELFSLSSSVAALKGAEVAVYLVHSMMSSSRLFQGTFHDTDLFLADNFARACRASGVRRIVYLGGLIPEGFVSPHLQSRKEVEGVLRSSAIPVTVLRAGMIVGPGGSSFEILRSLVRKLPVMILPKWTQSGTQAIFIDDVVRLLAAAVEDPAFLGKTFDAVNGESLTYEGILRQTAAVLGLRRLMFPVPIASTGFSKLWVQLFGNSTYELVSPLIDSLLCDLPQLKPAAEIAPLIAQPRFEGMLRETLRRGAGAPPARPRRRIVHEDSVRSIQRLPATARDCAWLAAEYLRWLPTVFRAVIRVRALPDGRGAAFHLTGLRAPLLVLEADPEASGSDREKFKIVGGLLTKTTSTGWLEFRQIDGKKYTLACLHDFVPRLPWPIYVCTQAPLHRWVMRRFGRHLEETSGRGS